MTTVAIVYHSGMGHTAKMAEAVAKGANSVADVTATLLAISGKDIIEGRFKNDAFLKQIDATGEKWYAGAWKDKVAGGFTVSAGPSGDKLSTLHYFFTLAMQLGMVWVGLTDLPMNDKGINRLSSYSGAMGQAGQEPPDVAPNEADKLTGEILGRRIALATKQWKQ